MDIEEISTLMGFVVESGTGEIYKIDKSETYMHQDGIYYYEDGEWWLENEDYGTFRESNKHDTNAKTFPYREPAGDDLPF